MMRFLLTGLITGGLAVALCALLGAAWWTILCAYILAGGLGVIGHAVWAYRTR